MEVVIFYPTSQKGEHI